LRCEGHRPCGWRPTDGGLHDHRIQGLIDPASWLQNRGDEAAGPQFGDLQWEITHLGGEGALMAVGTQNGGDRQLDQLLQAVACHFWDQFPGAAPIQ
jgi:hypothetical protein